MANYTMPIFQTTYSDDNTGGAIIGNSRANTIYGNGGADIIYGGDGNDIIDGGADDDEMYGDDGDDSFLLGGITGYDAIDGGAGTDSISASGDIFATRIIDVEKISSAGSSGAAWILGDDASNRFDLSVAAITGITMIFGYGGNDVIADNGDARTIDGGDGDDYLFGYGGADLLLGGEGNDTLWGGTDDDHLVGGIGNDRLFAQSGNDTIEGGEGDDLIAGDDGDDIIRGGRGNDIMNGDDFDGLAPQGDDLFEIGPDDGVDSINGGGGIDRIVAMADYMTIGLHSLVGVEIIDANGHVGVAISGGQDNDTLDLSDVQLIGINLIGGGGGNDILTGNDDANTLDGGTGMDYMEGRGGNDFYFVDSTSDMVYEVAGGGNDAVYSTVSWTMAAEIEQLLLGGQGLTGTGNGLANIISGDGTYGTTLYGMGGDDGLYGGKGADVLDGGTGADVMAGLGGDDRYYVDNVGDRVYEAYNEGTDSVYASVSFSLAGQHIEKLYLTGTDNINAIGNNLVNTLVGNSGNNILNGYGGADIMTGGAGDDTYYVDDPNDVINELPGEGIDRVFATSSYSLAGRQVEKLNLLGTGNFDATGNSFDNSLVGNSGDNVLNGLTGADLMNGGAGNDTYYVDNAGDQVVELAGGGIDTVLSTISFSLAGLQVENLTLRGTATLDGMGNSLANIIFGNTAANVLNGLTGDDELHGGLGADTLTGGAGMDRFVFDTAAGGGNVDAITDFAAVDDQIGLARSVFSALAPGASLAAGAFQIGTAALDADDRIVYNQATGVLYYDADGSGAGAMMQFARLVAGTAITAADFYVI